MAGAEVAETTGAGLLLAEAGAWLQRQRLSAGLTQEELAATLHSSRHYVSQVEIGHLRIRPDLYRAWADALGMPAYDFVRELLRWYSPIVYAALFSKTSKPEDH